MFLFGIFLLPINASAQFLDSISYSLKKKPTIFGTLDTRNTFIGSRRAEISGLKGGVRFNKFRIGLGYHFLATSRHKDFAVATDSFQGLSSVKQEIRYVSVFSDYVFHKSKRWEYNVALQVGSGRMYFGPEKYTGKTFDSQFFVLYEPTISAEYSILKWLGVSGKYGYRLALGAENFTAPIYAFGIDIYWGTIYRSTRKWIKEKRKADKRID